MTNPVEISAFIDEFLKENEEHLSGHKLSMFLGMKNLCDTIIEDKQISIDDFDNIPIVLNKLQVKKKELSKVTKINVNKIPSQKPEGGVTNITDKVVHYREIDFNIVKSDTEYDFNIDKWGTQYNAFDTDIALEYDNNGICETLDSMPDDMWVDIHFKTINTPPIKWITTLINNQIELKYEWLFTGSKVIEGDGVETTVTHSGGGKIECIYDQRFTLSTTLKETK